MTNNNENRNNWKIAFWSLIGIIAIIFVLLVYGASRPIDQESDTEIPVTNSKSVFDVSMTKKQFNRLSNDYLKSYLNNSDNKYRFQVNDTHANLYGTVKFLSANINFEMSTTPYVMDNGDVLLKVDKLKIGAVPLPTSFVLKYVQSSYKLPHWVSVDSSNKSITFQLSEYKTENGFKVRAKKIDLINDKILLRAYK